MGDATDCVRASQDAHKTLQQVLGRLDGTRQVSDPLRLRPGNSTVTFETTIAGVEQMNPAGLAQFLQQLYESVPWAIDPPAVKVQPPPEGGRGFTVTFTW